MCNNKKEQKEDEMEVRKATKNDLKLINSFLKKLLIYERKFDSFISKKKNATYYPLGEIKKMLKSKNSRIVIIEMDNKPIGMGLAKIVKAYSNWGKYKKEGYIGGMYLEKEFRGKGIGKKILDSFIKWFKTKKVVFIKLSVYTKNKKTIKSYEKNGFKDYILEMRMK